jgi:hypothetical protein
MCKEMPVILVNRVVAKKIIIGKMEGQGGEEAQGVLTPSKKERIGTSFLTTRQKSKEVENVFSFG